MPKGSVWQYISVFRPELHLMAILTCLVFFPLSADLNALLSEAMMTRVSECYGKLGTAPHSSHDTGSVVETYTVL